MNTPQPLSLHGSCHCGRVSVELRTQSPTLPAAPSARHGESVILPTRLSPLPLRSEMRVSEACARTWPPTAFFASGTNLRAPAGRAALA